MLSVATLDLISAIDLSFVRDTGNNVSTAPSISSDGRYVAFLSNATNLISGDTNGESDVS